MYVVECHIRHLCTIFLWFKSCIDICAWVLFCYCIQAQRLCFRGPEVTEGGEVKYQ